MALSLILSYIFSLFPFAAFIGFVEAWSFTATPSGECGPLAVNWTGSLFLVCIVLGVDELVSAGRTAPLSVGIHPVNASRHVAAHNFTVDSSFVVNGQGSIRISLPVANGSQFLVTMGDATGPVTGGASQMFTAGARDPNVPACDVSAPLPQFNWTTALKNNVQQCFDLMLIIWLPDSKALVFPDPGPSVTGDRPFRVLVFSIQNRYDSLIAFPDLVRPMILLVIIPGSADTHSVTMTDSNSFNWIPNLPEGTEYVFDMIDSGGHQGGVRQVLHKVLSGDNSCTFYSASSASASGNSNSPASSGQATPSPSLAVGSSAIPSSRSSNGLATGAIIGIVIGRPPSPSYTRTSGPDVASSSALSRPMVQVEQPPDYSYAQTQVGQEVREDGQLMWSRPGASNPLNMDTKNLEFIIHHLFLPKQIPQHYDVTPQREDIFSQHILTSAQKFTEYLAAEQLPLSSCSARVWESVHRMIESFVLLHGNGNLNGAILAKRIDQMSSGDVIPLHIQAQNAGVILRRSTSGLITFECFQASPIAHAVASNAGKLVMQFPYKPRTSMPHRHDCIKSLSELLSTLNTMEMADAAPVTRKAGKENKETRDVADIRYVSELVGGIIGGLTNDVKQIAKTTVFATKRIGDHVLWSSAELPWRRTPKWLILRVSLQTMLRELGINDDSPFGYKSFVNFLLSQALQLAIPRQDIPDHVIHEMMCKIATRFQKLSQTAAVLDQGPFQFVHSVLTEGRARLDGHWTAFQDAHADPLDWSPPSDDDVKKALRCEIITGKAHMDQVVNRPASLARASNTFDSKPFERTKLADIPSRSTSIGHSPPLPLVLSVSDEELWITVLDIEHWISLGNLSQGWFAIKPIRERVDYLVPLICQFQDLALSMKGKNPERFSRVFLTMFELWVALDKTVIQDLPLLADYSPEFNVEAFASLLVPDQSQMIRLARLETYLNQRHLSSHHDSSVFTFQKSTRSFGYRHSLLSSDLQGLRRSITTKAESNRQLKRRELQQKRDKYNDLISRANRMNCDYFTSKDRWGIETSRHKAKKCTKCSLKKEAAAINIRVFEWPLPEDSVLCAQVVFELKTPYTFSRWRDTTWQLSRQFDVDFSPSKDSPKHVLSSYSELKAFSSLPSSQNLTIASLSAKSHLVSHYATQKFPCSDDAVIKNHPLQYELYVSSQQEWVSKAHPSITIRSFCTPQIPSSQYSNLDWAIAATTHTSNQVMAKQSICHPDLPIHDYLNVGHLRSGHRLQYHNIALGILNASNLGDDFSFLLYRQALWQAESASDTGAVEREAHLAMKDSVFGRELLDRLRKRLSSSQENWQQSWVLTILSCVACRLVQLTGDDDVRSAGLAFLVELREVLRVLIRGVLELLGPQTTEPGSIKQLRVRLVQLAATCRSTFCVGAHVQSVLGDTKALHHFIYASLLLANNTSGGHLFFSHPLRYLLESDVVLSANLLPDVRRMFAQCPGPFDDAIREVWSGYARGGPWRIIGDRWVSCLTSGGNGRKVRSVHLNLLNGALRVDGKALDTLPNEIVQHPLYRSLFPGQDIVEIAPSTMNGMDYELRHSLGMTQVHFRLQSSSLIIRLRQANGAESEFISPNHFVDDFPKSVLESAILLYHDNTRRIEIFSSCLAGWSSDTQPDWVMDFGATRRLSRFSDSGEIVLSPRSPAVSAISVALSNLEQAPSQLLVLLSRNMYSTSPHRQYSGKQLLVDMPRYRLSFYIAVDGELSSRQFPGFSVNSSQSVGTLIGLKSRLVLERASHKCVVLPLISSCVHVEWNPSRIAPVITVVPPPTALHVPTCVLDIDPLLQRLSPQDTTVRTWLFLSVLHLLSSAPLPDPLTGESGIQRSFRMLSSARSFSFTELDDESSEILEKILKCSPIRQFYPKHLQCMETIKWNRLPPFIQDDRLPSLVCAIFEHNSDLSLFSPSTSTSHNMKILNLSENILVQRASHRYSRLCPRDTPAVISDVAYSTRPETDVPCKEIASLAGEVTRWQLHNSGRLDFWQLYTSWSQFSTFPIPSITLTQFATWFSDTIQAGWFTVINLVRQRSLNRADRFSLAFTLSVLAFRTGFSLSMARSLLLITIHNAQTSVHAALDMLPRAQLDLTYDPDLTKDNVRMWVKQSCCSVDKWSGCPVRQYLETEAAYHRRKQTAYDKQRTSEEQLAVDFIWLQWRRSQLNVAGFPSNFQIVRSAFLQEAASQFKMRFLAGELRNHAQQLRQCLLPHSSSANLSILLISQPDLKFPIPKYRNPDLMSIMHASTPTLCRYQRSSPIGDGDSPQHTPKTTRMTAPVHDLVTRLAAQPVNGILQDYCQTLDQSIDAFKSNSPPPPTDSSIFLTFDDVKVSIDPESPGSRALQLACLWPGASPLSLLRELALDRRNQVPQLWLDALSDFARSLLYRQRSLRLTMLSPAERAIELMNPIPPQALSRIDWLLIQLDSNFSIRPVQESVAERVMNPSAGQSMVTQLNMGEGKTSVITPIVSAALASGTTLVHVVVLKPLVDQSLHLLRERLSNLGNRPIFFMPFSRDVSMTSENLAKIESLFRRCQATGGILLTQPEHILSLHLMTVSYLCVHGESSRLSRSLLSIQTWLQQHSRLLLDESDELLKVKYQLVYTLGAPRGLTGQPRRWEIIQEVLSVLAKIAPIVHSTQREPASIELQEIARDGRFSPLRLLEKSDPVVHDMFKRVVSEVLSNLSFRTFTPQDELLLFDYVTIPKVSEGVERRLKTLCGPSFDHILLLRGLFAHGLLEHVFADKRFRVDYGLHPERTPLAVPYRSKDQPAQRAEFGHPDVILLLTLLSYYYTGLTDSRLRATFDILLKSDNAVGRYEDWIKPIIDRLPESMKTLNGLNLDDEVQRTLLFKILSYNKSVIDYYVARVVFPSTREFQHKLTTSAWDLADNGDLPVTGFSGTKDNRYLLPTSIKQDESQSQLSTTAIQLADLLQTQNDTVISTGVASAEELLKRLVELQLPSLLFDVGAQILELDNRQLAELWLSLETRPQYEAVVYFDPFENEAYVLHRDGLTEKFAGSLYRTQLDKCLVYLDEAHTRGTDFKFPPNAVAVVTLGPRLTKDKLVQGCMRLRQLATTQKVIFFCPSEVWLKVGQCAGKKPSSQLSLLDVVTWTIMETCNELQVNMPLWRQQGLNYIGRKTAWDGYKDDSLTANEAAVVFREPEAQSLEKLYGVARTPEHFTPPLDHPDCVAILEKCHAFGLSTNQESASMMEEQERELAHEKETEREVQRPRAATPFTHTFDPALYTFLTTGKASPSWLTLAECLQSTHCIQHIPADFLASRRILATKDFRATIQNAPRAGNKMDDYIRPVRWLLSTSTSQTLILLSPFEANVLVPKIQESTTGFLHLYSPRDMKNTETLEALDFVTIPRKRPSAIPQQSIHELNLFAGQLFFKHQAAYHDVCRLLGLFLPSDIPHACKGKVDAGGFVADPDARRVLKLEECKLKKSPIPFLQQLIATRRKGQGFTMTHVGKMVYGRDLLEDEFVN
ncbi:hypothetical protein DL96DRAFT_1810684 [Flagelloscypha sp. PMI_526]|nr:hypothetical protein DL96DRAFT_1810684 [Flagelloscypha sp. PMI_526]